MSTKSLKKGDRGTKQEQGKTKSPTVGTNIHLSFLAAKVKRETC